MLEVITIKAAAVTATLENFFEVPDAGGLSRRRRLGGENVLLVRRRDT
jgi:hypothetical protein